MADKHSKENQPLCWTDCVQWFTTNQLQSAQGENKHFPRNGLCLLVDTQVNDNNDEGIN